jgi:hypothetical protein
MDRRLRHLLTTRGSDGQTRGRAGAVKRAKKLTCRQALTLSVTAAGLQESDAQQRSTNSERDAAAALANKCQQKESANQTDDGRDDTATTS